MEQKVGPVSSMAYGTPYQEEDIIPYYTHIRHGKRPSDDTVEDLKKRYKQSAEYLRSENYARSGKRAGKKLNERTR